MIELGIVFGFYTLVSGFIIYVLIRSAREERKELEDRLMALSKPDALITVESLRDPDPAEVGYVDEAREYAITHGNSREIQEFDRLEDD